MTRADELLNGAIDMHFHSYPECGLEMARRYTLEEHAAEMLRAGMKGFVLKSHFWPTAERAFSLRQSLPGLEVFGSITLNPTAGGLKRWALEAAVKQGAKVVWLPTWSAKGDISRNGVIRMIRGYFPSFEEFTLGQAISLIDEGGELTREAAEIISLVKELDVALSTGHISPVETLAVAREAKRIDFRKLIFGHPDSRSVGGSFEQVVEVAGLGGYVEICALGLMPLMWRITPDEFKRTIQTVGASRCILTTDYFFDWLPSGPEMLRLLIACLLEIGITADEIREMAVVNPRRLLNLEME
ncbi:MAG TPA: DUF6282 family protein [Candidatus Methylomirabilis sp.]|nr:DUF6282 family protein [Candidatus Methylomirabilis sp.]HSC71173.1 DUF6282 family protein [Candidatus Methylomirabilis sp.]